MSQPLFDKILIANRGEIAVRIIKTCKKMGIKTVAVYSEADTNSLYVGMADEAIYIGHSAATESYLSIPRIIDAVRISGANAVHPGYGFLSENPKFATALAAEGVTLIGPSPKAIEQMGDKIEAKKIAQKAGVNCVPGYMGVIANVNDAAKIADKIGFPVMIKAAAGGGGRGMRVVYTKEEVKNAFKSASTEAASSFKDSRVFIEKFIESPRHIEIQLLADKHGNAICLGERECSIQRHHQKVIEEAPSVFVDKKIRKKMYDQVRSLAEVVGYYSAGTVEFIMDEKKNFYFLEMNTRLQVEHCVTELVTGVDIVEQMIRIAAGEKLQMSQDDVKLNGWAIESRIYAEDPHRGFLPSSGRVIEYREPMPSANIRIDSGISAGSEVSMFYDAMIAKLCSYGDTREESIIHMKKGLGDYVIRGIAHNISFLEAIMSHGSFVSGDITTDFIDKEYPEGFLGAELTSEINQTFLAVATCIYLMDANRASEIAGQSKGEERQIGTRWVVSIDGQSFPVVVMPAPNGFKMRQDRKRINITTNWTLGNSLFKGAVNDEKVSVRVEPTASGYKLTHAGVTVHATVRSPRVAELESLMPAKKSLESAPQLVAQMAGMISDVRVKKGDKVKAGQDLIVIAAMKMENVIYAERNVTIGDIYVTKGDSISVGQVIMEFEE